MGADWNIVQVYDPMGTEVIGGHTEQLIGVWYSIEYDVRKRRGKKGKRRVRRMPDIDKGGGGG